MKASSVKVVVVKAVGSLCTSDDRGGQFHFLSPPSLTIAQYGKNLWLLE